MTPPKPAPGTSTPASAPATPAAPAAPAAATTTTAAATTTTIAAPAATGAKPLERTVRGFWKEARLRLLFRMAVILLPLVVASVAVPYLQSRQIRAFANLPGNLYEINSVLLIMILASYLVVFISLVFYFLATYNDVFQYKGDLRTVKTLNQIVLWILGGLAMAVVVYLGYIGFTAHGKPQATGYSYEHIIDANRWLSFGIFFSFVVTDALTWCAQWWQIKKDPSGAGASKEQENNKYFAIQSLAFVSVPCAFVCGLSVALHNYLAASVFFHDKYDKSFVSTFLIIPVAADDYKLFLDGIETGLIATLMVVSQIVFAMLKAKWNYGQYLITGKCH